MTINNDEILKCTDVLGCEVLINKSKIVALREVPKHSDDKEALFVSSDKLEVLIPPHCAVMLIASGTWILLSDDYQTVKQQVYG